MPLFEKTEEQRNYAEAEKEAEVPAASNNALDDLIGISTGPSITAPANAPPTQSNLNSLVDLLGDTPSNGPTMSGSIMGQTMTNGLNDLLSGSAAPMASSIAPEPTVSVISPITAWSNEQISIDFTFTKDKQGILCILSKVRNLTLANQVSEFLFQAAVPKQLQIQMAPASSNQIPAGGQIEQKMRVNNPNKVALKMKVRIQYKLDGNAQNFDTIISNIPPAAWQ